MPRGLSIDGVRIPSAYCLATEATDKSEYRYFKGKDGQLAGPFFLDPKNRALEELRRDMSARTKILQVSLSEQMDNRDLPFECAPKWSVEKAIAENRRILQVYLRLPLFVSLNSHEKKSGNRFTPRLGTSAIFLHTDENGAFHRARGFRHFELNANLLDHWMDELLIRLTNQSALLDEAAGDPRQCAEICAETVEELYFIMNEKHGEGWHHIHVSDEVRA